MENEIFVVNAYIVDANGTFHVLDNYPKTFNSTGYGNDVAKAKKRAEGEWHEVMGAFDKQDTRKVQYANIVQMSNGVCIMEGRDIAPAAQA